MDIRLSNLISKKLTGEISDAEMHELNHLLDTDPHLKEVVKILEGTWVGRQGASGQTPNVERLLRKIQEQGKEHAFSEHTIPLLKKDPPRISKQQLYIIGLAVAALLVFGIFWFFPATQNASLPDQDMAKATKTAGNIVVTKPRSQTHLVLVDGTEVWLNGNSKLAYKDDFNNETREVTLSGEAFFDVKSNPSRPFIIHTDKVNVKVTGTTFNVRAYPDESEVETSLIHGKVEVSLINKPEEIFYLKPTEKLVLKSMDGEDEKEKTIRKMKGLDVYGEMVPQITRISYDPIDSLPVETAWVNNQLAFMEESFIRLADKMEKWYGVTIIFDDPSLEELRFTGKFEKETLKEALEALQIIGKFHFTINQNTVIISLTKQ